MDMDKETKEILEEMIEKFILIGNPNKDLLTSICNYAYMAGKSEGMREANETYENAIGAVVCQ